MGKEIILNGLASSLYYLEDTLNFLNKLDDSCNFFERMAEKIKRFIEVVMQVVGLVIGSVMLSILGIFILPVWLPKSIYIFYKRIKVRRAYREFIKNIE